MQQTSCVCGEATPETDGTGDVASGTSSTSWSSMISSWGHAQEDKSKRTTPIWGVFSGRIRSHHVMTVSCWQSPPICISVFSQPLLKQGNSDQTSYLHRGTPPICIAIFLPFVLQYFRTNARGWGTGKLHSNWDCHENNFQTLKNSVLKTKHFSLFFSLSLTINFNI